MGVVTGGSKAAPSACALRAIDIRKKCPRSNIESNDQFNTPSLQEHTMFYSGIDPRPVVDADRDVCVQPRFLTRHFLMALGGAAITCKQPNVSIARTNYSDFRRPFMSVYAVSISFIKALASMSSSGLSFTCRMNLPVPSSKPSGSAISAPQKKPTLT